MKKYLFKNNSLTMTNDEYNIIFLDKKKDQSYIKEKLTTPYLSEINKFANQMKIDFYRDVFFGNISFPKALFHNDWLLLFVCDNNKLYFLCDDEEYISKLVIQINKELDKYVSKFNNVLVIILFILNIIANYDIERVDKLQKQIDKLEYEIIKNKKMNNSSYNIKLLNIRKELSKFRKTNGNISEFIDVIETNTDDFESLKHTMKLVKNKNNRTAINIRILIEHVIQLKELYQNQLDVNLNNTMNIFTVISAIFLPLTLITSWYGMNFIMPEYKMKYGILIPIVLSVIIIVIIFYIIKKYRYLRKIDD